MTIRYSFLVALLVLVSTTALHGQFADFKNVDFRAADSIAALYPNHSIKDMRLLSNKLTNALSTDVEKFRSIFKWVCSNIDNDVDLYTQNKKKREKLTGEDLKAWEKKFNARAYGILSESHRTVCTGYAYLVSELAFHAGINCKVVSGYGRNLEANIGGHGIVNHSWNVVRLNNKWYPCDPTWSSGTIDIERRVFLKKFDEAYFLSDPEIFVTSHFPLDTALLFTKERPTLQNFLNAPLVYTAAFRHEIKPLAPGNFNVNTTRGTRTSFTFSKKAGAGIENAELYVENLKTKDTLSVRPAEDGGSVYAFDHLFPKKGRFAVHVVLNGSHAVTWNVTVN